MNPESPERRTTAPRRLRAGRVVLGLGAALALLPLATAHASVGDVVISSATDSSGGTVASGATFDVNITVTNNGAATTGPVTLEDQVIDRPATIPFVSGIIGGQPNGARIVGISSTGAAATCIHMPEIYGIPSVPPWPNVSAFDAAQCVASTLAAGGSFTMDVTIQANLTTIRGTLGTPVGATIQPEVCPLPTTTNNAACSAPAGVIVNLANLTPAAGDAVGVPNTSGVSATAKVLVTNVTP